MYAKSKECGEHDLQSLYHHQLGNAPSEALRATYSPTIDITQLRTSFIDFLAALSSLDYHELFHHQCPNTVVSSSPLYAKSKEYGEHNLQSLDYHQLGITSSEALRATYSPMIGIARLRTGFIGFLVALSSLDYHKLFHHKTFSHQKWVFHVYAKSKECGERDVQSYISSAFISLCKV